MLKHLTAPRLATIQAFFKTASEQDILGCYGWSQAVGAGLLPILGDFEVRAMPCTERFRNISATPIPLTG